MNMYRDYYNYQNNNYNLPSYNQDKNYVKLYEPYQGLIRGNMFPDLYNTYKVSAPIEILPENEQARLLTSIDSLEFALIDLSLYLDIYPDNEYMFMIDSENQKFITTVTFNRHLKKCCEALNIFYRSSHKIRFTNASLLNDKGVSVPDVQKLMGHASEKTTHGYLKSIKSQRETHEKVVSIFAS